MNVAGHLMSEAGSSAIAIIDGTSTYDYTQLQSTVIRLATELESVGTKPGDRVGIIARNSFFWVSAYLATLYAGRVAVPFPITSASEQVHDLARWVGARCMFVDRTQYRRFRAATVDIPVIDDSTATSDLQVEPGAWCPATVGDDDDAVLQLTSGTTSAPKAVRVSHQNIRVNTDSIVEYLGIGADDRMLVVLPFSYCFGASLLHTHLRVGGSVALSHSLTFPETVIEAIDAYACTGFAGVPSTYQLLLRASSLGSRPLVSLTHLQQAGGRLRPELVDQLTAAQPQARLFIMYGQTEATARLSYLPPEEIGPRRGSIGRGIPGVTLRVLDTNEREVVPGEVGEIVASGPSVTKGYLDNPEATAEKYRGGLLRTGDLATVDDDGYIYIVDRLSDFIKSWGFRVSSQEIEDAALRVPGVVAAAAVGIPDDDAGEAIALFLVGDADAPEEIAVRAALSGPLAKHMVPKYVRFLPELPLNANGKPMKSRLKELSHDIGMDRSS